MFAFLLGFGGPPVGLLLALAGGLMAWRGSGRWRTTGWVLLWAGVVLMLIGGVMYWQIAQVNWAL